MKDKISFWTVLAYAICLIVFGYAGYYNKGSAMSLISGGTFGILLLISCFGMYRNKKWGLKAAPILTAVLTVLFAFRGIASHKPVPIVLTCISAAVLILLLIRRK